MSLIASKKNRHSGVRLVDKIYQLVLQISVESVKSISVETPLYKDISAKVKEGSQLLFILPAFPAKSANREKTVGAEPDYGEVLGLTALNEMCEQIKSLYKPGAEIVICSDGRVFNDLVMVSDEDLMTYKKGINKIIQDKKLHHLKSFSLDDCYDHKHFQLMRRELEINYADNLESIRCLVKDKYHFKQMFNGIHRFMKEDLQSLKPELSKNQLMKQSKELAYKVIQRSGAWDKILSERFPGTLRLSIHPYPIQHRKFGVKLVQSSDRWATPWHNVALKINDKFTLVKRKTAVEMGAVIQWAEGNYAFYQL